MLCPNCKDVHLVMAERQGVEIDYCPQCRGVWLDRGELDKIIERSAMPVQAAPMPAQQQAPQYAPPQANIPRQEAGYGRAHHYPKKKESFLADLFDFD